MSAVVGAWAVEIGVIAWRDRKQHKRFPVPSEVLSTFVIFGALAIIPEPYDQLAGIAGWGLVVASVVGAYDPLTTTGGTKTVHAPSTTV